MKHRRAGIKKLSGSGKSYFISNPSDIFYLSGFSGTFARIFIRGSKKYFITDPRYEGSVKKFNIEKLFEPLIMRSYSKEIIKLLSSEKNIRITDGTGLADYLMLKKAGKKPELTGIISALRSIKTPEEAALIRRAVSINESGIRHIKNLLKPGITEKELSLEFDYYIRKNGADSVSFPPIVAFGKNSAVPHHTTGSTRLKKGMPVLLDCGVKYRGYCSDLTRVFAFCIIKNRLIELKKLYNIVRLAKKLGEMHFKNGILLKKPEKSVRAYLKKQGLEDYFTHSLGHSLGIDVHEPPYANIKAKGSYKPGMVFTCEPGIYIKNRYGIRIEDDYLITKGKTSKFGIMDDGLINVEC